MDQMIAFCGLDCSGCEAYQATLAGDEAVKHQIWEKWKVEYNAPDMPLEDITCDGCIAAKRAGGYCPECPVRACGMARGVVNCAYCEDYQTCGTLQSFIADIEDARENLAAIRASL
jgi:hypothetical protein